VTPSIGELRAKRFGAYADLWRQRVYDCAEQIAREVKCANCGEAEPFHGWSEESALASQCAA
jgi:hypothetical protein